MSHVAGELKAQSIALMERVLRDGAPIAGEYPLCFREPFSGRVLALEDQGRIASACTILVRDCVIGATQVRCGMIGSVCTDPERRGRGHASELLRRAERELTNDGCVLALLWADDPMFYVERGWQAVGAEIDFTFDPSHEHRLGSTSGIRAAAPDDWSAIHRLYTRQHERVERSREETLALLAGPRIETLVVQRSRDVAAYSCLGRGLDFARTVHEWSGSDDDVIALVRAHMQRARQRGEVVDTNLITPPSAGSLHHRLRGAGVAWSEGVLAQGKLLDLHAAGALLSSVAGAPARVGVDAEIGSDPAARFVTLDGPRGSARVGADEILELLFPARGRRARIEAIERATGLGLPALPLPLFVWGLDSI